MAKTTRTAKAIMVDLQAGRIDVAEAEKQLRAVPLASSAAPREYADGDEYWQAQAEDPDPTPIGDNEVGVLSAFGYDLAEADFNRLYDALTKEQPAQQG